MAHVKSDPLLAIAKILVLIGQGLTALGAALMTLAIPLVLFFQDRITAEMREEYADPNIVFPTLAVVAVLFLGAIILALAFYFLLKMRRIIETVGEGDPFVPENAERLTGMAWLMLAMQVLAIPAAGIAFYLSEVLEDQQASVDATIDLNGVIIVVVLFVLARVFRQGTAMREDLEGTV